MAKKNIATFLGPQLGLTTVGEFAHAYSGTVQATTSNHTMLFFTTGASVLVGKITCVGGIENNGGGVATGTVSAFTLSFNGQEITRFKTVTAGTSPDAPMHQTYPIIIPPRTEVKVVVFSTGTDGKTSVIIAGRVHDA